MKESHAKLSKNEPGNISHKFLDNLLLKGFKR